MRRRLLLLVLALLAAAPALLPAADPLLSWQRRLNLTLLEFATGGGEIEILNPSTFRFVRCRVKPCAGRPPSPDPVPFRVSETNLAFEFRTSYLEIRVRKNDGGLMVKSRHGVEMLDEIVPSTPALPGLFFQRRAPEGERLFGLGARADADLNLRGKILTTDKPLLISSLGYGLWFSASTRYEFDLASRQAPGRVAIRAPFPDRLEMYFHYGPSPKEILEENYAVTGWSFAPTLAHTKVLADSELPRFATKVEIKPLPQLLTGLAHATMSGLLVPALDQSSLPPALAPLFPMLFGSGATSPARQSLQPYLFTYLMEAKERGFPLFRPMAMQYPKDVAAATHLDQFMLGDELLAAAGPQVYLPMGIWTDLRTGLIHQGRQSIPVAEAPGLPVYAKNGTIIPLLQPDGTLQLHYLPRLGAEFFISEPGHSLPSQVHAGPAAGVLRLEIESRVDREYEWIVYHVSPATLAQPAQPKSTYNAKLRRLHIPVQAKAMGDSIINVTLEQPLEP